MKRFAVSFLCILLLLGLTAASASALEPLGTALPKVDLPGMDDKIYSINELLKDKVGVLVWWSVTCPHCQRAMPGLINLDKSLKGNPYIMITLNTDSPEMLPASRAMVKDFGLPMPALLDLGKNDSLPMAEYYDVVVTPTVIVVDMSGKMIYAQESEDDLDKLKKVIIGAIK